MPIYEYDCPSCGRFEQIQRATDKALKKCPQCAEKGKDSAVQRVVSAAAFHLKGSGWYKTDYSSTSSGKEAKSDSSNASSGDEASTAPKAKSDDKSTSTTKKESGSKKGGCGKGSCGCH